MLKLKISNRAEKFLRGLPAKHQRQISSKILELKQIGHLSDSIKLKGERWYRTDSGEYRIIYDIEDDCLLMVVIIGKRNDDDVYKQLKRL